jgi:hypothetical protein
MHRNAINACVNRHGLLKFALAVVDMARSKFHTICEAPQRPRSRSDFGGRPAGFNVNREVGCNDCPQHGWGRSRAPVIASTQWARNQSRMAARVGDILYRTACAVAAPWAAFILVFTATWTIATPVAAAGAVLIRSVGRGVRYVLSGH